ncbi:MAG: hypothetical protein FWD83_00395 [Promicromonosporaceae bacterium]|nr:hypothetical protein [Promicromonosporaceae bacterium]
MKTTIRKPSKAKAGLCAAAAVAVLLGGASTFARWAEEADLLFTGVSDPTIFSGSWTLNDQEGDISLLGWFDTSAEVTDDTFEPQGNDWIGDADYGDWLDMPADANNGGLEITLADFAVVPGDQLTGIFAIALPADADIDLVGEHLVVEVEGAVWDNIEMAPASFAAWGDTITVTPYTWLDEDWGPDDDGPLAEGEIAIVIEYAFGDDIADSPAHHDAAAGNSLTLTGALTITGIKVTVVQTR